MCARAVSFPLLAPFGAFHDGAAHALQRRHDAEVEEVRSARRPFLAPLTLPGHGAGGAATAPQPEIQSTSATSGYVVT